MGQNHFNPIQGYPLRRQKGMLYGQDQLTAYLQADFMDQHVCRDVYSPLQGVLYRNHCQIDLFIVGCIDEFGYAGVFHRLIGLALCKDVCRLL